MSAAFNAIFKACMKELGYAQTNMKDGTTLRNSFGRAAQVRIPSAAAVDAFLDTLTSSGQSCPNKHFKANHNANVPWLLLYPAYGHTSTNAACYARRYFGAVLGQDWVWRYTFVNAVPFGKRVYRANDSTGWNGTQAIVDGGDGTFALRCVPGDAIRSTDPIGTYGYETWPNSNNGQIPGVQSFFGNINKDLHQQARAWAYGCQVKVANVADINNSSVNGTPLFVAQVGHDPHASPAFTGNNDDRYIRPNGTYTKDQYQGWPLFVADGDFSNWRLVPVGEWMWQCVVGVAGMWRHEADFWGIFSGKIPFNKAPYAITEAEFDAHSLDEPPLPDGSTPAPAPAPSPSPSPSPAPPPSIIYVDTRYRTSDASGGDTEYDTGDDAEPPPPSGVTSVVTDVLTITLTELSETANINATVTADEGVSTNVNFTKTGSAITLSVVDGDTATVTAALAGTGTVRVESAADPTKFVIVTVLVAVEPTPAPSQLLELTRLPMRPRGFKG